MKRTHWIIYGYAILSAVLLLFSYTQVDLNLTLSRSSIIQTVEKAFQHVGYYQRPLATSVYAGILVAFFVLYSIVLSEVRKNTIDLKTVWMVVLLVTCILVFSYPAAFSYDFFNYMFTAKTIMVYHQNPYVVTPLSFAGLDPWTNFMRWTHLTTAYAPLWIGMTLIPYIVGLGYFVTTLFAMKFMVAGFYLLTAWALVQCMERISSKQKALSLAIFALNPLILIESLVSAHNDVMLTAFAVLSVFFYLSKDLWSSWWWLALSIAAKTVTLVLMPVMILKKDLRWFLWMMLVAVGLVLFKREFLPWYWVWVVPFVALLPERGKITRFATIVSFGLLFSYAPYLYFGDYGVTEQLWKTGSVWIGVGAGIISLLLPSVLRAQEQ